MALLLRSHLDNCAAVSTVLLKNENKLFKLTKLFFVLHQLQYWKVKKKDGAKLSAITHNRVHSLTLFQQLRTQSLQAEKS